MNSPAGASNLNPFTSMRPTEPEGILLVDKPPGCTSHDVVARLRRLYSTRRVGHAGTLDPMATGLLLLLVGRATKVSQYLMSLPKVYAGVMRLGQTTDTQDADGEILEERPVPADLTEEQMRAEMAKFLGDQYQTPPMYSAKKIQGTPLYKLARKGQEVEREPRVIHVARFEMLGFAPPEVRFELACSKGTYVRTVIHDLGLRLGCGAHMASLRRTAIDRFRVEDSITLEQLEELPMGERIRRLVPVYQAVPSHVL